MLSCTLDDQRDQVHPWPTDPLLTIIQVQNVTRAVTGDGPKSSSNLADKVQTLISRLSVNTEDFVRSVYIQLKRAPIIVLYTDKKIKNKKKQKI